MGTAERSIRCRNDSERDSEPLFPKCFGATSFFWMPGHRMGMVWANPSLEVGRGVSVVSVHLYRLSPFTAMKERTAPSCMHMNLVYSNGTKNRQKLAVPNRAIEVSNVIHFGRTKLGNNGGPLRKQASQSAWFTASMSHSSFAPDIYKGSFNRRK